MSLKINKSIGRREVTNIVFLLKHGGSWVLEGGDIVSGKIFAVVS